MADYGVNLFENATFFRATEVADRVWRTAHISQASTTHKDVLQTNPFPSGLALEESDTFTFSATITLLEEMGSGELAQCRPWMHITLASGTASWPKLLEIELSGHEVGEPFEVSGTLTLAAGVTVDSFGIGCYGAEFPALEIADPDLRHSWGGSVVADDYKTYTRGGQLVFTADVLKDYIGETWTLAFGIRAHDGEDVSSSVRVYPYQDSGVSINKSQTIAVTGDWQDVELAGLVHDFGTKGTGAVYDGTANMYKTASGVSYTFGEMFFWGPSNTHKYDVRDICLIGPDYTAGGGFYEHPQR